MSSQRHVGLAPRDDLAAVCLPERGSVAAHPQRVLPRCVPSPCVLHLEQRVSDSLILLHPGHCVLTVGTGKAIEEGSSWSGLVSSHDYAVIGASPRSVRSFPREVTRDLQMSARSAACGNSSSSTRGAAARTGASRGRRDCGGLWTMLKVRVPCSLSLIPQAALNPGACRSANPRRRLGRPARPLCLAARQLGPDDVRLQRGGSPVR